MFSLLFWRINCVLYSCHQASYRTKLLLSTRRTIESFRKCLRIKQTIFTPELKENILGTSSPLPITKAERLQVSINGSYFDASFSHMHLSCLSKHTCVQKCSAIKIAPIGSCLTCRFVYTHMRTCPLKINHLLFDNSLFYAILSVSFKFEHFLFVYDADEKTFKSIPF